jgi:putative ABC transport system ATP-binding protein
VVMVTHDLVAASYSGQVIFLADGQIVGTLDNPTPGDVLDRMRALGGEPAPASKAAQRKSSGR